MKVLTFDIATSTGVAYGAAGGTPRTATIDLGKGLPDVERFAKAIRMTKHYLEEYRPDAVFTEAPIGGKNASQFLIGVAACVRGQTGLMGFPVHSVNVASVRKHFLGRHYVKADFPTLSTAMTKKEIKRLVQDRCALLGWRVDGDDQADAAALWDYACAKMRVHQSTPSGGLFT